MNHFVPFRLTTQLPIERFKNLPPAVRSHTVIIWDEDEAFFWCEKHNKYFEENEHCPRCKSELDLSENTKPEFKARDKLFPPRFFEGLRRWSARLIPRRHPS